MKGDDSWAYVGMQGNFVTNSPAYVEVPMASITFTQDRDRRPPFEVAAVVQGAGCQIGLRIDGEDHAGPTSSYSHEPMNFCFAMDMPKGKHVATVIMRQAVPGPTPAILVMSELCPLKLSIGRRKGKR